MSEPPFKCWMTYWFYFYVVHPFLPISVEISETVVTWIPEIENTLENFSLFE